LATSADLLELSAPLADGDHVVDERRELARPLERRGDGLASRMESRAFSLTSAARVADNVLTMSIAVSSGTPWPAAWPASWERERASIRTSSPKTGGPELVGPTSRGHEAVFNPAADAEHRRGRRAAPGTSIAPNEETAMRLRVSRKRHVHVLEDLGDLGKSHQNRMLTMPIRPPP